MEGQRPPRRTTVMAVTIARPDSLRRPLEVSTRPLSDHLTQVSTPERVLGFVRAEWNGYAALRGTHLASARLIGCYASHGLALEALRQRPSSL